MDLFKHKGIENTCGTGGHASDDKGRDDHSVYINPNQGRGFFVFGNSAYCLTHAGTLDKGVESGHQDGCRHNDHCLKLQDAKLSDATFALQDVNHRIGLESRTIKSSKGIL